jgi:hypothetical protein
MVPSNILLRVFHLRVGSQVATGFTIEVDERQYLITAKHVVTNSATPGNIDIFHDTGWIPNVPYRAVIVEPNVVDIAVLALNQQISVLLPITLGIKGAFLSQKVFFIGFPFSLSINGRAVNNGFPLPLVKHGIISAIAVGDGEPFLVDGINNPGFSGGPVVIANNPESPRIIGVISGYRTEQQPVSYEGQEVAALSARSNTGLLVAFEIEYALRAIEKIRLAFLFAADRHS